jgi:uncharacterized membrane protein
MHKILISIFDTETAAFEGVAALKELHRDGDITLYGSTVVAKAPSGWMSVLRADDPGPAGTLAGLVGGTLVGLLGGPVGVAVGATAGAFGGMVYDMFNAGVGMDFVNEVGERMGPGKVAIVADVDETWITPVETRLGALGGTTFRRLPDEVTDEALVREAQAARDELDHLQAELKQSTGEAKATVEAAIERQRSRLSAIAENIDTALDQRRAEVESRIATLRAQRAEAREREQARIDARIDELKASYAARKAKLEHARDLAKQAASTARQAVFA